MERSFAGHSFRRVGAIQPERDSQGAPIEERLGLASHAPLHKYGEGPFCRFRIAQGWQRSGVYVLTCDDAVRYVGACKSLATILELRWPHSAISSSPQRGQQTHCRINALIMAEAKQEADIVLWFYATEDGLRLGEIKARLVNALNPPWNLTSPLRPTRTPSKTRAPSQSPAPSAVDLSVKEGVTSGEGYFAGIAFSYVGPVRPERDGCGEVIAELPQSRFRNQGNLPLSKYGGGPFCRFGLPRGWQQSGVYVLANGYDPLYVGECQDLQRRWGPMGYGHISPRACFKGGQDTNCRINNLIYKGAKTGTRFDLWFRSIEGDKHDRRLVESQLMVVLRPSWNK